MGGPALQRYCCGLGNKLAAKLPGRDVWTLALDTDHGAVYDTLRDEDYDLLGLIIWGAVIYTRSG